MKFAIIALVAALSVAACGHGTVGTTEPQKSEGPPVGALSHDQLMAAYHECTQYGRIDDPSVKYTARYCAAVQQAQLSAGYVASSTAKVDPSLNKMH